MMFRERYERRKKELLQDKDINSKNRQVIKDFLTFEEYKLKRKNSLPSLDERSYKTLYFYIGRFYNLNIWFKNKDWSKLIENDIKKVIDDLEDGKIVTKKDGKRLSDRSLYYQMMRGKLFSLVGKDNVADNILKEFSIMGRKDENEVRFFIEDDFRKIVDCAITPTQKCLLWLAWDIGENINSLLELEKDDFKRQINIDTKEPEYLVILKKEKLKRSRTPRTEITNYPETTRFLDIVLKNLKPTEKIISNKYVKNKKLSELHNKDKLFKFQLYTAVRFMKRAVKKAGVSCVEGQEICWKYFRNSMACHLLKEGWTTDEVNARLGHKPSSHMIDKYVNYLALDRAKPKKKVYESNLRTIQEDLEKNKELNRLQSHRVEKLQEQMKELQYQYDRLYGTIALEELEKYGKFGTISDEGMLLPIEEKISNKRRRK